jgi:flagellar assembly protein FliH
VTLLSHLYTDFGSDGGGVLNEEVESFEDTKLDAFENGYKAGWDDAAIAHKNDTKAAVSQIAQRLDDMSFTHREVQGKLVLALKPLLANCVSKLLPEIGRHSLYPYIFEKVEMLLKDQTETPIEVVVSSGQKEMLENLMQSRPLIPFTVTADTDLTLGQVFIRVGAVEREINFDAILEDIRTALESFIDQEIREKNDE